jgi:regulatory protein
MGTRRALSPLDDHSLSELALRYAGRFATTRAKLRAYLKRKIRERGWTGERPAELEAIVNRFADLGYVDDRAYAMAKSRALTGRGYGKRRVVDALRVAGVDESDGEAARDHADADAVAAALRFAQRRRIGPYATTSVSDPKEKEKAFAAIVRAGHGFGLARAIVNLAAGAEVDEDQLAELASAHR